MTDKAKVRLIFLLLYVKMNNFMFQGKNSSDYFKGIIRKMFFFKGLELSY